MWSPRCYARIKSGQAQGIAPTGSGDVMQKWFILILAVLLVGCGSPQTMETETVDFVLERLDGGELALSDLRGEYVLVNFWATWCVPCRKEMPYLQELSDEQNLVVLGVNLNEDVERVRTFIDEMGFTFPILLDPPDELKIEHGVRNLPVSFVVDRDGVVVHRIIGEVFPEQFDVWLEENLE